MFEFIFILINDTFYNFSCKLQKLILKIKTSLDLNVRFY